MLSVTGLNHFYYVRDFSDMRCKHSRVLSIIREQLHREPNDGDVFIVMSKDRRIVRMFTYDNRSYSLFEKKFVSGYQFMKVCHEGGEKVYRIDWRDVVLLLENPIVKELKNQIIMLQKYLYMSERIAIFFYEDGSRGRDVLTHFLGDAELKSIMTDGYNAYVFIGDELKSTKFKDTEHQICMAHAMAKFAKAANPGGDKAALPFHDDLSLFYKLEDRYDEEGISPEERGRRRQSLETKEILIRLRSRLDMELAKDETERSPYLTEALNYLNKFWDGIFAYQKDGNYPIDNNIAERTIRKLTTQRNNSLHYGSDEGVEMAVAYHSVISTVKLHGMSCWRYLGEFFKKIFNGCRDFFSLTPANIGMAYAKYRANEYKASLLDLYRVQPIFKK